MWTVYYHSIKEWHGEEYIQLRYKLRTYTNRQDAERFIRQECYHENELLNSPVEFFKYGAIKYYSGSRERMGIYWIVPKKAQMYFWLKGEL